jgi:DNA invertase Pin-like site-specific DNA recombinase
MSNVAIYARVSTPLEDPKQQIEQCREWVEQHGYTVEQVFQDCATGAELKRPGMEQLLETIKNRAVGLVVASSADRFARTSTTCNTSMT